jgi:outer membrane receptor protein involved in Fe transport
MKTLLLIFSMLVTFIGIGQNLAEQGGKSQHISAITLKGIVLDSSTQKPVPFASIMLKNISLQTTEGITCNEKGEFNSGISTEGDIELLASCVGFLKKSQTIKPEANTLITIMLRADNKVLAEVTIVGDKPMIEEKVDRIVYNAERDIAAAGSMATDLLRKMPMISADLEGNVQVRGSGNFKVLIDGKPSVLASGNPSEALKQIPAETIKSIELITSPSAKYDAEGGAIINIITKRKLIKGFSTNTNVGAGNKGTSGFIMMSYKKKKWAVSGSIIGNALYNRIDGYTDTYGKMGDDKTLLIHQLYEGKFSAVVANAKIGAEYNLSEKDLLTLNYTNRTKDFTNNRTAIADYFLKDSISHFERYVQTNSKAITNDVSLEYTHYFKKTQQELSLTLLRSNNHNDNVTNIDVLNEPKAGAIFNNESYNYENIFQADYQNPVKRNRFLELGLKVTTRQMNNKSSSNSEGVNLNYAQSIYAGYVTYLYEGKKKWSLKSGLRLEHTANDFTVSTFSNTDNYTNIFPSLAFIKKLSNARNVKVNYSYRIQRPSIMYLNPSQSIADPLNTIKGNPYLMPEFTHNIESSYSTYFKANSLIITAFAKYINNPIGIVNQVNEVGIVNTVFANIKQQTDYGVNIYGSFKIIPKWQTVLMANIYYSKLNGGEQYSNLRNEGFSHTIGMMTTLDLPKKWSVQLAGSFNSSRVQLQGRIPAFTFYNLAVKKGYKNSSWSLGIDNPFAEKISLITQNNTPTFDFTSTMNLYARGIRLTFTHRFGKLSSQDTSKEKKGGSDLKQEETLQ